MEILNIHIGWNKVFNNELKKYFTKIVNLWDTYNELDIFPKK